MERLERGVQQALASGGQLLGQPAVAEFPLEVLILKATHLVRRIELRQEGHQGVVEERVAGLDLGVHGGAVAPGVQVKPRPLLEGDLIGSSPERTKSAAP